jgi:hypothetical protein
MAFSLKGKTNLNTMIGENATTKTAIVAKTTSRRSVQAGRFRGSGLQYSSFGAGPVSGIAPDFTVMPVDQEFGRLASYRTETVRL